MRKLLLLASALAIAALPMSALANRPGYGFVRVEAGNTKVDLDVDGENASDDDSSYSIRGGYYFSPNWAVEGFYTSYGEREEDGATVKLDGFGAGIVGKKNFGDDDLGFYLGGRAGVVRSNTKIELTGFGGDSDDAIDAYAGISAGYDFTPNLGLGIGYDYFKAKPEFGGGALDLTVKTVTLGLEYRF